MVVILAAVLAGLSVGLLIYATAESVLPRLLARFSEKEGEVSASIALVADGEGTARQLVLLKFVGPLVGLVLVYWMSESPVFALAMAAAVFFVPDIVIENMIRRRRDRLEAQASDVMMALSSGLKSGLTLEQAIDDIAENMAAPASEEFALIRQRIDAGQLPVAAFRAAEERIQIPRLTLIFQTIVVSLERGGRLASLMDRLSEATREIERVEERVRTETAGIRMSSYIMLGMPFVLCGLLYLAEPNQVLILFNTFFGNVVLVIALAFEVAAYFIMKRIIDLDV